LVCSDQSTWTQLLRELPTLDDIGFTVKQKGDECWGVQIPWTDAIRGQGGGNTTTAPSKGKGKVMQVIASDDEVSSNDDALLER
jgi:hypothetical protein